MVLLPTTRRDFLKLAGATTLTTGLPGIALAQQGQFTRDFKWGVGSAAGQVESRQGRGRSNWDVFIDAGQHVKDGTSNLINTDFENRYMDDFRLLSDAGVQSFRFSFAWPRIQPEAAGSVSKEGIDTYDRMLDGMLELGMEPFATMFHWDVPVWAGDLRDRELAYRMAEYADILTRQFGDRIPMWALLNEPNSVAFAGYMLGMHAPGLASADAAGAAIHHQNLASGLMAQAARANLDTDTTLVTTVNLAPIRSSSNHPANPELLRRADEFWNRTFLDPLYGKGYPLSVMPLVSQYIKNDDLDVIAFKPEAIGVNYYCRIYIEPNEQVPVGFVPDLDGAPQAVIRTDEYFFEPDGMIEILRWVDDRYGQPTIYLTETGFAIKDATPKDGVVRDPLREKYLKAYLRAAHDSINQGVDLRGIYYWSATDNFEWAEGLSKKFGLIQIDPQTLQRTPKSSLNYYGSCAQANAVL